MAEEAFALGAMVDEVPDNDVTDDEASEPAISDEDILSCLKAYKAEAEETRTPRLRMNERNVDAFFSRQDWGHKEEGQSAEFLPKTAEALKQFKAFVKRGLTDYGDWFTMDLGYGQGQTLDPNDLRRLLLGKLETLNYSDPWRLNFATLVSDGLHTGVLEALTIKKVYWEVVEEMTFEARPSIMLNAQGMPQRTDTLVQVPIQHGYLRVDLLPFHEYLGDPKGRGLYEIQSSPRDLYEIQAMAEGDNPTYDPEVVEEITTEMTPPPETERPARMQGQQADLLPESRRKGCIVDELWGTILGRDGRVLMKNMVCTVVNERYIVRRPTPNPNWDGQSPFVVSAIDRVPFSTLHQALFDDAVALNLTMNEITSLLVDGGIAEVWGIKQLRRGFLKYPEQVSGGIPQGTTLEIDESTPPGTSVLETVSSGKVPQGSMQLLSLLMQEFHSAALTNDLQMQGNMGKGDVTATEVVETQQGRAGLMDGILRDLEDTDIEPTLRKAWLTLLQHMDQLPSEEVVGALGVRGAFALAQLSPAQRYAMFHGCTFKVQGLSASLARMREFQKWIALLNLFKEFPGLGQIYAQKYSMEKTLGRMLKGINVDPAGLEADPQEQQQQQQTLAENTPDGAMPPAGGGGPPLPLPGRELPEGVGQAGATGGLVAAQAGGMQ